MRSIPFLTTTLCTTMAAALSATAADKSQYNLFRPTPPELLRPMSTDRPDATESPSTVDAGHFQLEADFFNYTYDRDTDSGADTRTTSYTVPALNLKVGLLNDVDFQLVIDPYVNQRVEDRVAGTVVRNSGFGDIQTRLKINFWGNDEGRTAFGIMPFAKWPTADSGIGNGSVEGGLIVPFAVGLPAGFEMGLMTEFDFLRDAVGSGYHTEFVNTLALGRDIVGGLGAYTELITAISTEDQADWVGAVAIGFTYGINDNLQLDAGVNIGVTESADDWNPFVGISWRY